MADITTGIVRFSYLNTVFKPAKNDQGVDKYSVTLLIPKTDKATYTKLKAAYDEAVKDKWGVKPPKGLHSPIHDGDGARPSGGDYAPECHGHWVLGVSSNRRPGLFDANLNPVIDPGDWVSGDYGKAVVNTYTYQNKLTGVAFGLQKLQFLRKGEALGGSASTDPTGFEVEMEDPLAS